MAGNFGWDGENCTVRQGVVKQESGFDAMVAWLPRQPEFAVYWIWDRTSPHSNVSDRAMLRLTKKADYGLMAMKLLGEQSHRHSRHSMSAKEIADEYHMPLQLLAKVLQQLTRAGLLESHAGTHGGYSLTRAADDISAFEVILAIDGPFFITNCVTAGRKSCDLHDHCTIKEPLQRLNDTFRSVLTDLRISDLSQPVSEAGHPPGMAGQKHELVQLT